MTPLKKSNARRAAIRKQASRLLISLVNGDRDIYEAYRQLYGLWCSNNAAVPELRPLFQMPGVEPDGPLTITDEFRSEVETISRTILPQFQS
jgi:hypothetical protein